MHQISELIHESTWTSFGLIITLLGVVLLVLPFLSRFRYKLLNFSTRKVGGEKTIRRFYGFGFTILMIGVLTLVAGKILQKFDSTLSVDYSDWVGDWTVALEENGSLDHNTRRGREIELELVNGELRGTLYNEKGRVEGHLSSVAAQANGYAYLSGKLGHNDGRKMKVEFMMLPDERTFMGRYKLRHGRDRWRNWISHRK